MRIPRLHARSMRRAAGAGLAVLLGACFAADPMPSPGAPDTERILLSATPRRDGTFAVLGLIGLPGAVEGTGRLLVTHALTGAVSEVVTGAEGSFAAVVSGAAGDRLVLRYSAADGSRPSDPVEIFVPVYDEAAAGAPETPKVGADRQGAEAQLAVAAPDDSGVVRVTGSGLQPTHAAAVGNVRTGEVVEAVVPESGTLTLPLRARPDDALVVIVRSPETGSTSEIATLRVPAP